MNQTTITVNNAYVQEYEKINKIIATLNAENFVKLLGVVALAANPRKSKVNKITQAIAETLESSPEMLKFMSKGLLISTESCTFSEHGTYTLSFEKPEVEGVLDGGHNMLAIGLFMLTELLGSRNHPDIKKIKKWDEFVIAWKQHKDDLSPEILAVFQFDIPVEIIYPASNDDMAQFFTDVLDISSARNNNCPLTVGTKADHRGYYDILKESLDPKISEKVEWIDNDTEKSIKRDDIVAMSLIPFIALQDMNMLKFGVENKSVSQINPVSLYSGKGKCVNTFSEIYEKYDEEQDSAKKSLIESAFAMAKELPKLYDYVYSHFPQAYNTSSPGFGRIRCVIMYDPTKKKGSSGYLPKQPVTKFYELPCDAKYPDGFIIPIFCGLSKLMKIQDGRLIWGHDPNDFLVKHLDDLADSLVGIIRDNSYNPQGVGKNQNAYKSMAKLIELYATR